MRFICIGIIPRVTSESVDNLPFIGKHHNTVAEEPAKLCLHDKT